MKLRELLYFLLSFSFVVLWYFEQIDWFLCILLIIVSVGILIPNDKHCKKDKKQAQNSQKTK